MSTRWLDAEYPMWLLDADEVDALLLRPGAIIAARSARRIEFIPPPIPRPEVVW